MTKDAVELGAIGKVEGLLAAIGPVEGKVVVDVGCGEGLIAKTLAGHGAHVTGYDPFMPPTERTIVGPGSYAIVTAQADSLPLADGSADVVLFVFSLHHVPGAKLASALLEARRVLKPEGLLCVAEPLAEGAPQYVMQPYHDETEVRRRALEALNAHAAPAFGSERVMFCSESRVFPDWKSYADQAISNMRYNGYSEADVLQPEVRRRFDEMLGLHAGRFEQRIRINLFGEAQ